MQLILIGYGKMNRLIEALACEQGHTVAKVIRSASDWSSGWSPGLVAIDFSVPGAVLGNLERAMTAGIPTVIGTTGWYKDLPRARELVEQSTVGAIYGANFSVGMNAFFRIVSAAAQLLPSSFDVFVEEAHHRHKKDAPSGTAGELIRLLESAGKPVSSVASIRAGSIPGTHTVGFDAEAETITLTHSARSRRGFAEGALQAARWVMGRRGFFNFGDVFESLITTPGGR